ncbi:hypothetical protein [Pseudomonas sp. 14P_5.3_Bac1]|uniref:hypothetical protein n=1 Tax=Pseudomonas sp. 14P_5.3_Bac1 TaxID=2971622 RepID=UPI0021C871A6|nr:hypothetical protein [Pseudomonas sp. 14P_5.3_Bac1]MCU1778073.1 hypothetical protein [Pseudomonas sp. 14P_5.3_Bac1]
MTLENYPRKTVFFAFLLCPFFSGLAAVPMMLITVLITVFKKPSLIGEVRSGELFSLFITVPIMAQLIFLFPAVVLAIVVTFFKLEGRAGSYLVISIVSAVVSSAWMSSIVFFFISEVENYQLMRNIFPVVLSFLLGGISTGVAAYWFLPRQRGQIYLSK